MKYAIDLIGNTSAYFRQNPRLTFYILLVFGTFACFILIFSVYYFALNSPDEKIGALGQTGDFIGGTLNPLLTFFTLLSLVYTVHLQRLALQTNESAVQNQNHAFQEQLYQTHFFQLLSMHNSIVSSINCVDPITHESKSGRPAFNVIYSKIRRLYKEKRSKFPNSSDSLAIKYAYERVYRIHQYDLGHYFRFLYNAILVIEKSPNPEIYIKILRSQISNQELLVLYYNCAISLHGKNFRRIAEDYHLFDNMPPHLFDPRHGQMLNDSAFGEGGYSGLMKRSSPTVRGNLTIPRSSEPSSEEP